MRTILVAEARVIWRRRAQILMMNCASSSRTERIDFAQLIVSLYASQGALLNAFLTAPIWHMACHPTV